MAKDEVAGDCRCQKQMGNDFLFLPTDRCLFGTCDKDANRVDNDIVARIRRFVASRGGPAKDENGKPIGNSWPMMLEAADEIERLRKAIT